MERTQRSAASHIGHGFEGQLRSFTQRNNRSQRGQEKCFVFGYYPRRCTQTTDVLALGGWKSQVADALTKLQGDGDLLRALRRQAFTVLVEAPEIMAARRQENKERERVPRVKSPSKLREPGIETSIPVTSTPTVT